jgi:hypothetical protein
MDAGKIDASKPLELGRVKNTNDREDLLDWVIEDISPIAILRKEKRQRTVSELVQAEEPTPI